MLFHLMTNVNFVWFYRLVLLEDVAQVIHVDVFFSVKLGNAYIHVHIEMGSMARFLMVVSS